MPIHPDAIAVITVNESGAYAAGGGGGSSNPNGQATAANSAPVVIASNQSAIPTNATEYNSFLELTGTIAANNVSVEGVTDLRQYNSVSVQITGTWVGNIQFQVSNDGTNWINKFLTQANSFAVTGATLNGMYTGDIGAKYFRANSTVWTSGTASLLIEYSSGSYAQQVIAVSSITTSMTPGNGTTFLGKAKNAAAGASDTGVSILAVRNDSAATASNTTNGAYAQVSVDTHGSQFTREKPANISSTVSQVSVAQTSVNLTAAAPDRRRVIFYNGSANAITIKYGTTASATSFTTILAANQILDVPASTWAGAIDAISTTGTNLVNCTVIV